VVGLAAIAVVLVLGFIKFTQIRAAIAFGNSFPQASETVEAITAERSDWQQIVTVVGQLRASREVELRNEFGGVVAKVGFVSAAPVEAGQILLQLNVAQERANLAAVEAEITLARLDVERLEGLVERKAISQQEFDRAKVALDVAKARASTVREVIVKKTVVAPFTGLSGIHDFEVGEFVAANSLVTRLVGGLERLWVDFSMPQEQLKLVLGTSVQVNVSDISPAPYNAKVVAVEPSVSELTRSIRIRAELLGAGSKLTPGSIVKVTVPVAAPISIFMLPSLAIRRDSFGNFVFVLNKDEEGKYRASRRPVSVLSTTGDSSVIGSGLVLGELIASKGSFKLRDGIWTKLAEAKANQVQAEPASNFPTQKVTTSSSLGQEVLDD
jgi:membrane fusion protein (multidrug efflux system)